MIIIMYLLSVHDNTRWSEHPVGQLHQKLPMVLAPTVSCSEAAEVLRREGFDQMPVRLLVWGGFLCIN